MNETDAHEADDGGMIDAVAPPGDAVAVSDAIPPPQAPLPRVAVALIVASVVVTYVGSALLPQRFAKGLDESIRREWFILALHLCAAVGLVLAIWAVILSRRPSAWFGVGRFRAGEHLGAGIATFVVLLFTQGPIGRLAWALHFTQFNHSGLDFVVGAGPLGWSLLVVDIVVAAACEEVLFRGILIGDPASGRERCLRVVAAAVLFGAAHWVGGSYWMFSAACDGLVLGAVYSWTRSLWPGFIAHVLLNGIIYASLADAARAP